MKTEAAATKEQTVAGKWDNTFKERVEKPARRFSWHSSIVSKFQSENYLGGKSVMSYLTTYLGSRRFERALDIGSGLGVSPRGFLKKANIGHYDLMDVSTFAVEHGNKVAQEEGLAMTFIERDLNHETLPENTYDLVTVSGALHHIENLEHLFEQIARTMTADGVFFANDYMGPNHMQWTDRQLHLMNAIVDCLPDEMNRVTHKDGAVRREVTRIPLAAFARSDPSEGVRAADIFPVMEQYLDIEEIVPLGQTIVYEALRGRMENFVDDDPKDAAILKLICVLERELMAAGDIPSDFNLVIARKRKD